MMFQMSVGKGIWWGWELLRWDVWYLDSEWRSFIIKKRLLPFLTQMNANIRWSSPKQISFSTKNSKEKRSFSVNIYRTLSLSTELSPIKKCFVRETFTLSECYICSLNVLYTNSVIMAVAKKKTYDWGNVRENLMTGAIDPWLSSLPRY